MSDRPGVVLARRPLHVVLVADCSGSMSGGGKMASLNTAVRESLPHLASVAQRNPHAQVLVRAIAFSTGATWHISEPTEVDDLQWRDLRPGGYTDLGAALRLLGTALAVPPMEARALPPAVVLVSDGMPTDDYGPSLDALMAQPWGARSVRMAVAIGQDADHETLVRFIGDPALEPVTAANPEQLVRALKWATTQVSRVASSMLAPDQVRPLDLDEVGGELVW